jgi:ABC-type transport system involved in multi-copper enzyme maturation permease subunit
MRLWGMIRFTIGETLRKGTLLFYFGVGTFILIIFASGIGQSPEDSNVVTLFGNPVSKQSIQDHNVVEFILVMLHRQSVSAIMLFGIFGIAGLIPSMLEKGKIDLFLSKPLTRGELLMARSIGAVSGIAINLIYFFLGIWLIFGLRIGVWHWGFLSSVIYVIIAFFCYYSVVAIVGLITRSTGFSILLAFLFSIISWGLEKREQGLYVIWDNSIYHRLLDGLYYLTPQLSAMLENSTRIVGEMPLMQQSVEFTIIPFVYSLLATSLLYFLAVLYFSRQDY